MIVSFRVHCLHMVLWLGYSVCWPSICEVIECRCLLQILIRDVSWRANLRTFPFTRADRDVSDAELVEKDSIHAGVAGCLIRGCRHFHQRDSIRTVLHVTAHLCERIPPSEQLSGRVPVAQ
jgi:hypothetical protein